MSNRHDKRAGRGARPVETMPPLKSGDLATVVAGPAAVVHVVYDRDTAVIAPIVWHRRNEGIRWIRGHHDVGSDEVLALFAAWALS